MELTKRALQLCRFSAGAALVDIGCGEGQTVRYVNSCTDFKMTGVDKDGAAIEKAIAEGACCLLADAAALPFCAAAFDGVFFECSFSKIEPLAPALLEARRLLKERGRLVITDFYADAQAGAKETTLSGLLGRVEFKETIAARLAAAGFELTFFEDHTKALRQLFGQLIFDFGRGFLDDALGKETTGVTAKLSYGLFIAEKVTGN